MSLAALGVGFVLDNKQIQSVAAGTAVLAPYLEGGLELIPEIVEDVGLAVKPLGAVIGAVGNAVTVVADALDEVADEAGAVEKFLHGLF